MQPLTTVSALVRAAWAGIDPEGFFRRHAADREPFAVWIPRLGEVLFFATAEGARDILSGPAASFRAPLPNPIEPVVGEHSLILLSGAAHRRARSVLTPPFRGELMRWYVELIAEAATEKIATLQPGDQLLVGGAAQAITLDVVIRVVFGVTDRSRRREYSRVTKQLLRSGGAVMIMMPWLRREVAGHGPWARLVASRAELDRLLSEHIEERRGSGEHGNDVLGLILRATDDEGNVLSDDMLRDQLRTMLVAGHETSSTALAWAMYHIHQDENIRSRVLAELAGATTPSEIAALPYLGAVVQETLRVHPTVPIVLRRLTEPLTVAGVPCCAGDVVGIALPALHFNPGLWTDPDVFDPQRFLDAKPSPFQYAPFGGGYRRCIGAVFAHNELVVAIGTILKTLELRAPVGERGEKSPRAVPRNIATKPSREIALEVIARR
jgi:cytochrome P450